MRLRYTAVDMYSAVLALHIGGGVVSLGLFVSILLGVAGVFRRVKFARPLVAIMGTIQLISGSLLALLSESVSALSLCDNLALYMGLLALMWYVLHREAAAPVRKTEWSLLSGGAAVFLCVLVLGA